MKHYLPTEIENRVYYLASPYSSDDAYTRELRYLQTLHFATDLINRGYTLIEPIAMSHQHAQRFSLPTGYSFWKKRDRLLLSRCHGVIVYCLPGWDISVGVSDEIAYAKELGLPVYYAKP